MLSLRRRWEGWGVRRDPILLLVYLTTTIFGFTAIAHQNNLAATSSLLAGDTLTQYGWVIGLTLFGLGVGFFLSRYVSDARLLSSFIAVELLLMLVGGFSVVISFWGYINLPLVYIWFIRFVSLLISILIGIEDAILVRIAENRERDVAQSVGLTFWFSNIGGALAGFSFGQLLIPSLGIFNLALALGLLDGLLVLANLVYLRRRVARFQLTLGLCLAILIALFATLLMNRSVSAYLTQSLYHDRVVKEWSGPYGSKVLTCSETGTCKLFINGQLQFSSKDEYQYHERLIHPALALVEQRVKGRSLAVLIAGGGDGLAAREVLKHQQVGRLLIVDIDPDMTGRVAREEPVVSYNNRSLFDPRVEVLNADAFTFLRDTDEQFDLIVVDLVDPDNESAARLYSEEFYHFAARRLNHGGVFVTQSTSPWYAARAFWTINLTLSSVFRTVVPYRWNVPSFGDWGWNMASDVPFEPEQMTIDETLTRGLTTRGWLASLVFERGELAIRAELEARGVKSTLAAPAVQLYYNQSGTWEDWGDAGGE